MPNIYKLSREGRIGYDEFRGLVVVACDREQAKRIHPYSDSLKWSDEKCAWVCENGDVAYWHSWVNIDQIVCEEVGETHLPAGTVILISYRAG